MHIHVVARADVLHPSRLTLVDPRARLRAAGTVRDVPGRDEVLLTLVGEVTDAYVPDQRVAIDDEVLDLGVSVPPGGRQHGNPLRRAEERLVAARIRSMIDERPDHRQLWGRT